MRYLIYANTIAYAEYLRELLYAYGYNYKWELVADSNIDHTTLKIHIFNEHYKSRVILGDQLGEIKVIFTTDPGELGGKGIKTHVLSGKTGYCIRNHEMVRLATPLRLSNLVGLDVEGDWTTHLSLFLPDSNKYRMQKFAITSKKEKTLYLIVGIDLYHFVESNFSSKGKQDYDNWGDAFGDNSNQGLADIPTFDALMNELLNLLQRLACNFLPISIGFYPPGKTAPLIITGDTDSATNDELESYIETFNSRFLKISLMVMGFDEYSNELFRSLKVRGNSIGIHPYSQNRDEKEYVDSFSSLIANGSKHSSRVIGVRNHRFQRINDTLTTVLAATHSLPYDFNGVASSNSTWIGTGSGIGLPIPIPSSALAPHVLHFPTIIEDDVFIYDHDYCYQSLVTGVFYSDDVCIDYLHRWLIEYKLPCAINLHPEHIRNEYRFLIDRILAWANQYQIWAPSLDEYHDWQIIRRSSCIDVLDKQIYVDIQKPATLKSIKGDIFTLAQSKIIPVAAVVGKKCNCKEMKWK